MLTCSSCFLTAAIPLPCCPFVQNSSRCCWSLKNARHCCRSSGDIMSMRFSTSTRGFMPIHLDSCGWVVDTGMRASSTSSTTSTLDSCSFSCRSAFAMWPGYHCTSWVV
jgi:hypothetical protein